MPLDNQNTFVSVSPDCPATAGTVPQAKGGKQTIATLEYGLLTEKPYHYTLPELIFEVHVRHKEIPPAERKKNRQAIWDTLFSKNHACMRASALPKRYGWGVHYNDKGKLAIYGVETTEYKQLSKDKQLKQVNAVRSSRK